MTRKWSVISYQLSVIRDEKMFWLNFSISSQLGIQVAGAAFVMLSGFF